METRHIFRWSLSCLVTSRFLRRWSSSVTAGDTNYLYIIQVLQYCSAPSYNPGDVSNKVKAEILER